VTALTEAVAADPKNPSYRYHLGMAYASTGNVEKAREALTAALKLSPNFEGAGEARQKLTELKGL
jgi:Flp pilus assembly protein TadD